MGGPLRDRRTPQEFAERGQLIEFTEKISEFAQLADVIREDLAVLDAARRPAGWQDSEVVGRLSFGFADARETLPALEGEVEVTVDAVCQRCLEPFRLPLRAELQLLFANDAPAMQSRDGWEVWDTAQGQICPLELVGEALVMAVPLAPKHADDSVCGPAPAGPEESASASRPFAGLKARMEGED